MIPDIITVGIPALGFIIAGICISAVIWVVNKPRRDLSKDIIERNAGWHANYRQLREANDAVITQMEAHPDDFVTLPPDVRELIYSAHEGTAALGRNNQ